MLKRYSCILLLPEISMWLFVGTSIVSYKQNELFDNIYGWPYPYYTWFYMDGELHHSTGVNSLVADAAICFAITLVGAVVYHFAKRHKE